MIEKRTLGLWAAWIGSVCVVSALLWFFTAAPRSKILLGRVNRILAESGESSRLSGSLPGGGMGLWFSLAGISPPGGENAGFPSGGGRGGALVFTLMRDGISAACVALINSAGEVEKIFPLDDSAALLMEELPPSLRRIYEERIAAEAKTILFGGAR